MINETKLIEELNRQKHILTFEDTNPIDEGFNCGIDKAIQMVESQPKVSEWIPCSERLPESCEYVLVSCVNGAVEYGAYYAGDKDWSLISTDWQCKVLAWQPLPKPYEVREND